MEAALADALPAGEGWWFEPKWDGFRCLAFRAGDEVELRAKSGKSLSRYFPDLAEALRRLPVPCFVIDGELAIPIGGVLSFDALQMRLHPARSRVLKLAGQSPARLIAFDCLVGSAGASLIPRAFAERRRSLEALIACFAAQPTVILTPGTADHAEAAGWLERVGGDLDGVVAKALGEAYAPGKRALVKVKRYRTADCVVGGWRAETGGRAVASLLLGLYDGEGLLHHVGFTSAISDADRPALTRRLEALAGPSAFAGKAPGAPSRWSGERSADWRSLRPELVVEVRYDHVTGQRLRHGAGLVRFRPDKAPAQCGLGQLRSEAPPARLATGLAP